MRTFRVPRGGGRPFCLSKRRCGQGLYDLFRASSPQEDVKLRELAKTYLLASGFSPDLQEERVGSIASWEDLAWERTLASVDSPLGIARADAVVGRDGSSQGNTRNRLRLVYSGEDPVLRGPVQVSGKKLLGEPRFTRIHWCGLKISLR